MIEEIGELTPPARIMLTPGPSCVDPRVYRAMAAPIVGHVDPWFTAMMGDVQTLLAPCLSDRESHHLSDFRLGLGRHRSGRRKSSRRRRRMHHLRERRVFRPHGHHGRAHLGKSDPRRSALRTHGRSRRCAPRGQGPQDQDGRLDPRRNVKRGGAAHRRLSQSGRRAWRAA